MSVQRIGGYVVVAVVAAAAGAGAMRLLDGPGAGSGSTEAIDVIDIADVSSAQAEALRESRFETLATIEDILALPGEFTELEALYAVTARASSGEIQNLLYQAVRVGDPARRDAFVRVLLKRLVELDPRTAVAVVDGPLRRSGRDYRRFAWRQWARRDFEAALTEASLSGEQNPAVARALYAALPSIDDPRAAEIEALLGIGPDAEARAAAVQRAFADGADAAIALLDGRGRWSPDEIETLAGLLFTSQGTDALDWVDRSASLRLSQSLRAALLGHIAEVAPERIIDALDGELGDIPPAVLTKAFNALAEVDIDAAFAALDRAPKAEREGLEQGIIAALSKEDPARAFAFVETLPDDRRELAMLRTAWAVAARDFDAAMSVVPMLSTDDQRMSLLGGLARTAPLERMAEIGEQISALEAEGFGARFSMRRFTKAWTSRDPEGAINWLVQQPESRQNELLPEVVSQIAAEDPARAVEMTMSLEGSQAATVRQQLARTLGAQEDVESALSVAALATSPEEQTRLQSQALMGFAQKDADGALARARETGNQDVVDFILSFNLAQDRSGDPGIGLERAAEIRDPQLRSRTEGNLITRLGKSSPDRAREFIATLPPGERRDNAVAGLVMSRGLDLDASRQLASQISDDRIRERAEWNILVRIGREDPDGVRRMMDEMGTSDAQRARVEEWMRSVPMIMRRP